MTNNEGTLLIRIGELIYTTVKDPTTHKNTLYRLVEVDMQEMEEILNKAAKE